MPKHNNKWFYHALTLLTVVVWVVAFVNTKILIAAHLTPTEIFVYRIIVAYIGLLAVSRFRITFNGWRDEALFAALGITGGSLYFICQNTALKLTLMTDVGVLIALNPLLTTLLAAIFLREERFTWLKLAGSAIAFAGVGMLTFENGFVWGDGLLGDILAFGAALSWAIYSVILKRLNDRYSPLTITRKTFFYGLLTALPVMLSDTITPLSTLAQPIVWGNLVYLGLIASMAAYFAWGKATREIGAVSTTNYLYLNPVISMIIAWALYGESVGTVGMLGCLLIFAGILIVQHHATARR